MPTGEPVRRYWVRAYELRDLGSWPQHQVDREHDPFGPGIPKQVILASDHDALHTQLAQAQAKMNTNRCNKGHETLPLYLWDCPACHDETRAERDALQREVAQWKQDAQLLTDLLAILQRHCGERGQSEGAVETLERLERELAALENYENESLEQPSPLKIVPSTASDGTGEA